MHTLFDAMAAHARCEPERIAFTDERGALTRIGLLADAARLAAALPRAAHIVGLLLPNTREYAVAQIACAVSGRLCVPLPTFFCELQLVHILSDAGVEIVLVPEAGTTNLPAGIDCMPVALSGEAGDIPDFREGFGTIIYTSGSTGRPKGVRHESGQVGWSAAALATAIGASQADSYLSVLPLSLLLEGICAIFVPVLVGGRTHFATDVSDSVARGRVSGIAQAFASHRPSIGVTVPEVLRVWVGELLAAQQTAPDSLRFIAAGGAKVPTRLADAAWQLGIPVHEGYGLSECCSVVAVNRPGTRAGDTVGRSLPGIEVSIRDGEIVVDGPSVMDGYLGGTPAPRPLPTGDLGAIDAEGRLVVFGRKDNLIITALGRNVSPEWVEAAILGDPGIAFCAVGEMAGRLVALIVPTIGAAGWFADAPRQSVVERIGRQCAELPSYAQPADAVVVAFEEAQTSGLLTANGRVRRAVADRLLARCAHPPHCPAMSHLPEGLTP